MLTVNRRCAWGSEAKSEARQRSKVNGQKSSSPFLAHRMQHQFINDDVGRGVHDIRNGVGDVGSLEVLGALGLSRGAVVEPSVDEARINHADFYSEGPYFAAQGFKKSVLGVFAGGIEASGGKGTF